MKKKGGVRFENLISSNVYCNSFFLDVYRKMI